MHARARLLDYDPQHGRARLPYAEGYAYDQRHNLREADNSRTRGSAYEEYHPYGSSAYRSSNGSVDVSARRYRYNGKERDEETGLYYYGARYLAAWLGRWTSADPLGIGADGPGLYNYTRGSPVNYVDPNGTDTLSYLKEAAESVISTAKSVATAAQLKAEISSFESDFEIEGHFRDEAKALGDFSLETQAEYLTETNNALEQNRAEYQAELRAEVEALEDERAQQQSAEYDAMSFSEKALHGPPQWGEHAKAAPEPDIRTIDGVEVDLNNISEAGNPRAAAARAAALQAKAAAKALQAEAKAAVKASRKGPPERFKRFGSAAEAEATTAAKGLAPRPGHRGPKRIADEGAVLDPRKLGSKKSYSHRIDMETNPGVRQWLKQWEIEGEPGRYAIPEEFLAEFNRRLRSVVVTPVR